MIAYQGLGSPPALAVINFNKCEHARDQRMKQAMMLGEKVSGTAASPWGCSQPLCLGPCEVLWPPWSCPDTQACVPGIQPGPMCIKPVVSTGLYLHPVLYIRNLIKVDKFKSVSSPQILLK